MAKCQVQKPITIKCERAIYCNDGTIRREEVISSFLILKNEQTKSIL